MANSLGGAGDDERVTPTDSNSICAAVPQHREAILEIARLSGLFPPEGIADIETTLDAFFAGTTDGDQWLVNSPDSDVAAIAYYAPERMTDGTWNLYLLAVHPQRQGQGLGAALVRQIERDLRSTGARVLLIETSGVPDFAGQRAFYTRLGYHQEARIREFYAPGDDKVVYWKLLQRTEPTSPVVMPVA